jgi:dihydropyrimidinase
MTGDLLITGAILVDEHGERPGCVRVRDGRIAAVTGAPPADASGCDVVDGAGCLLLPGGVDPHVHFALPAGGTVTADDFASGGAAALAGGTTTVIDFVTPGRDQPLTAAVQARLAEAAACACDYTLHLGATAWRPGLADELRACVEGFGLRSLKLYMAYLESIGLGDGDLGRAMAAAADLDLTVLLHCEMGRRVAQRQRELLAFGDTGPAAHPRSRPPEVEAGAVERALELAAAAGCRPYIVHMSTAGAVDAVAAARAAGRTVLAETCPQYLLLDESVYAGAFDRAAAAVMSPPLRAPAHRDAMRRALAGGVIDTVGTDHCSFTAAQKAAGRGDFTRIPGGAAGVQHRLALLMTLAGEGLLSRADVVRVACSGPARAFGLYPRKGALAVGADADLVLWDPDARGVITAAGDRHAADQSVYEGLAVRGKPRRVWLRGACVVDGDRVTARPGGGIFLGR